MNCILKQRKLIGVIISECESLYQHKILDGVISQCYALDYDVAIFSTFVKDTGSPEYKIGEKNIFNLINFNQLDGVLVMPLTFVIDNLTMDIENLILNKCKCPVISIDSNSKNFINVNTNDRASVEQITDHLIEHHGYKNIICLAANPEIISTMPRVNGYKDSLEKHNISFDENKVFYEGNYWYSSGTDFAEKIIKGLIPKPDAIVSISDHMAIGIVNELIKHGIRVPEDIAVTGFDATNEAATCISSITSFDPPIEQTGADAVCELTLLMTGIKPEPCRNETGILVKAKSCGCDNNIEYIKRSGIASQNETVLDYKSFLDSYMTETLAVTESFEDCLTKICYYLYLIQSYSDFYLCLCDNWDGSADNYSCELNTLSEGYTDIINLRLACESTKFIKSDILFNKADMIPNLWVEREKPKAYYFTPLHFNERCLGYSVITYGDKINTYDITYRSWSRNIMNALEFTRVQKKLFCSSFRDVLTGIYNRNGLDQNLPNIKNDAIIKNKKILVVMCDVDCLKVINDNFGHHQGDNTITVVANAFQSCCTSNEICARIGGDEIIAIGCDDYSDNFADEFIKNVRKYIDNYNALSGKPYKVQASMGAFCDYITPSSLIDDIIDIADKKMYSNKVANKMNRK